MISKIFFVFLTLSVVLGVTSSVWLNAFIAPVSYHKRSSSLSMGPVVDGKQRQLDMGKEKYAGRSDLVSMVSDEDDEVDSYSLFAEADDDEAAPPKVGQTITGTIIEMDDNGALLEIGGKMSGYLPLKEAALIPIKHVNTVLEIGQELTAEVIGTLKGMPVISLRTAQLIVAWANALQMRVADATFEAKVIEVNRGGVVVDAGGLKCFLPGSHYLGTADDSIIGNVIKVKFLDVDEDAGKLVVSQKRAAMEGASFDFKKGAVVSGTITGLRNYGAFLELEGGMAGLLHISQISQDRVENLENLFKIGQKCKVMILEHDKANGRVALSTKALEPTPGDMMKDMEAVFAKADATAIIFHQRIENERLAREAAAKEIVAGLGGVLNSSDNAGTNQSIESILESIVNDANDQ